MLLVATIIVGIQHRQMTKQRTKKTPLRDPHSYDYKRTAIDVLEKTLSESKEHLDDGWKISQKIPDIISERIGLIHQECGLPTELPIWKLVDDEFMPLLHNFYDVRPYLLEYGFAGELKHVDIQRLMYLHTEKLVYKALGVTVAVREADSKIRSYVESISSI